MAIGDKPRIIIIDGASPLRSGLRHALMDRGCIVKLFSAEDKGLNELSRSHYDLLIVRVKSADEDSLRHLMDARRISPETLLILLASRATSEGAVIALREGASDLLVEPFSAEDVANSAETAIAPLREEMHVRKVFCCIVHENREFLIPSDEPAIGPVVDILVENLTRAGVCSMIESRLVAMALTEAIANAMYHGNLNISPRLKLSLSAAEFLEEIRKRKSVEEFRARKIRIRCDLTPAQVKYVISDEGEGFDHREALSAAVAPADVDSHAGRGLFLLRNIMDEVIYNEKGNEVTLIKRVSFQ
ncbi:MAG: ATP-binding protein [Nitrospinae bacterium]|nr:ATP-binding protein [Nitrospinota bacterium]MBF0633306.1 ATP-binding protein [Nitrospinota bacterium]